MGRKQIHKSTRTAIKKEQGLGMSLCFPGKKQNSITFESYVGAHLSQPQAVIWLSVVLMLLSRWPCLLLARPSIKKSDYGEVEPTRRWTDRKSVSFIMPKPILRKQKLFSYTLPRLRTAVKTSGLFVALFDLKTKYPDNFWDRWQLGVNRQQECYNSKVESKHYLLPEDRKFFTPLLHITV